MTSQLQSPKPFRWLDWEEEILMSNRCRNTPAKLLAMINKRRRKEGLPLRDRRSLERWSYSRKISLSYWRGDEYSVSELAATLGVSRHALDRLCREKILPFTVGDRKSHLIRTSKLARCLMERPEIAARWPHKAIDNLAFLVEEPVVIERVKAHRQRFRVRHRDGREWGSIKEATKALGVSKDTIKHWATLPNPPLTIGV